MALFSCPECGNAVSTRAESCPRCGCPLDALTVPEDVEAPPVPVNSITVSGTSPSEQRAPRELDLTPDGEEIQFHIHAPGGQQRVMWVRQDDLQRALNETPGFRGGSGQVEFAGRTARKPFPVVLVWDESEEIEVQAGWWIWVRRDEFLQALGKLGLHLIV